MDDARRTYATFALRSLPRLLSLQDRNPFSKTSGCFHRDFWLYKTSDFPDAVRQFGVHALALAYTHDFSADGPRPMADGRYYRNPALRDWAVAGLDFWAKIQHDDGSFDEFYPYERGWVGPTAFTTYACGDAYRLLRNEIPPETARRVETALRRAARFITAGEHEEDHLANHHAMALLAVGTAADVLNDRDLWSALPRLWERFLRYHDPEGWALEYDGPDPGYLSATVSFLAKLLVIIRRQPTAESRLPTADIRNVLRSAVTFCSYFVFPDGAYAGTTGSRNTVHFYPHGFELQAPEMPLAASIADRLGRSLADGYLVPPEIMSDRYVHYRVPEYLLAALDAGRRPAILSQLPHERPPFTEVFPKAGVAIAAHGPAYTVANLRKGGVIRSVHRQQERVLLSDTGWSGKLTDGRIVSSQWIDPDLQIETEGAVWTVRGRLQEIPSQKHFTLWTNLAFRALLAAVGWNHAAAHWLKGRIRKALILGRRPVPCAFERRIELADDRLTITDELRNDGRLSFQRLTLGGDLPLRYVPQSLFFQLHELDSRSRELTAEELAAVNRGEPLRIVRAVTVQT